MLFKQKDLEGIKGGKISLAFRKWKKLSVAEGNLVQSSVGILKIGKVEEINLQKITVEEAEKAGFKTASALIQLLEQQKEGIIYRIEVAFHSENPSVEANDGEGLDEDEFEILKTALDNLDKYSKIGKWTVKTLQVIRENPKMKAADLAVKARKEKEWLKLNIRKLKALGLTISHEPGYTLSAKGEEYLKLLGL